VYNSADISRGEKKKKKRKRGSRNHKDDDPASTEHLFPLPAHFLLFCSI